MKRVRSLIILLCSGVASALLACETQVVSVVADRQGNSVQLSTRSTYLTEYYLELSVEAQNLTPSHPLPAWFEQRGDATGSFVTLTATNPGQPWRYNYKFNYKYGLPGGRHDDSVVYRLPYAPGARFPVIQGRGGAFSHQVGSPSENAIDFAMPEGTAVCAARAGVIVGVKQDSDHGGADMKYFQCANFVMVRHDDGTYAEYLHLQRNGAAVQLGQRVNAGDVLGRSGNTGFSSRPHLHFVVFQLDRQGKRTTLPVAFLANGARVPDLRTGIAYVNK